MRESHACGLKTAISPIKDNFSRLTHKSGRVVLKTLHLISDLLCIISLLFITIAKAFKCLQSVQIVSVQRSSKHLRTFSQRSEVFGKTSESSEVAWMFSEILLMTRQKSHAFDSEKVGRYTNIG